MTKTSLYSTLCGILLLCSYSTSCYSHSHSHFYVEPAPLIVVAPAPVLVAPAPVVIPVNTVEVTSQYAPPAEIVEPIAVSPGIGYVWVKGHWIWNGNWVWNSGHWLATPHPSAVWTPGCWTERHHHWVWIEGYWQ